MQFDVCRNLGMAKGIAPYLLELQHNSLGNMRTTVVAPLVPELKFAPQGRLTPRIPVLGQAYFLSIAELFAIERHRLGPVVTNVEPLNHRIVGSLDLLFTGV